MRTKITSKGLPALRKQPNTYVYDTDLPGFGIYVGKGGRVTFLIQRWIGGRGGKSIRHVYGRYPELSLDGARKQAISLLAKITDGIDVNREKKQKRHNLRVALRSNALGDVIDSYLAQKKVSVSYRVDLVRTFKETKEFLGERTPLKEIAKANIRRLLDHKKQQAPIGIRNFYVAIRPFFQWCVEQELIDLSPVDGIKSPPNNIARERVLTDQEITALWRATRHLPIFGSFLRVLLLTGQRRNEVAGMMWNELDLDGEAWNIPSPRTKNAKPHIVHLSAFALAEIEKQQGNLSPFVFPATKRRGGPGVGDNSQNEDAHISGFNTVKSKLDRRMLITLQAIARKKGKADFRTVTLEPWVLHDLRRTIASHMAAMGILETVADRILNHVASGSTAGVRGVYQRYEFLKEREAALDAWGDRIGELVR